MTTMLDVKRAADEREIRIRHRALELACTHLGAAGHPHKVRKIIAQQIMKAMEKGEYDPVRLCSIGLAALGPVISDTATERFAGGAQVLPFLGRVIARTGTLDPSPRQSAGSLRGTVR